MGHVFQGRRGIVAWRTCGRHGPKEAERRDAEKKESSGTGSLANKTLKSDKANNLKESETKHLLGSI